MDPINPTEWLLSQSLLVLGLILLPLSLYLLGWSLHRQRGMSYPFAQALKDASAGLWALFTGLEARAKAHPLPVPSNLTWFISLCKWFFLVTTAEAAYRRKTSWSRTTRPQEPKDPKQESPAPPIPYQQKVIHRRLLPTLISASLSTTVIHLYAGYPNRWASLLLPTGIMNVLVGTGIYFLVLSLSGGWPLEKGSCYRLLVRVSLVTSLASWRAGMAVAW